MKLTDAKALISSCKTPNSLNLPVTLKFNMIQTKSSSLIPSIKTISFGDSAPEDTVEIRMLTTHF